MTNRSASGAGAQFPATGGSGSGASPPAQGAQLSNTSTGLPSPTVQRRFAASKFASLGIQSPIPSKSSITPLTRYL